MANRKAHIATRQRHLFSTFRSDKRGRVRYAIIITMSTRDFSARLGLARNSNCVRMSFEGFESEKEDDGRSANKQIRLS